MTNYKEIITANFCFKVFDIFNPEHQNKHLGQTLEKEISIKLLEMYPDVSFIVADVRNDNIKSKKAILNAGYTFFEGNQYHFIRR